MLFFYESCNGCCPWLWPLFSYEMIECSELSDSFYLAFIHTVDVPLSNAQYCTVHHNTLQWPQLPASLKKKHKVIFNLEFKWKLLLLLCSRNRRQKFSLHSTQSILFFSRFCVKHCITLICLLRIKLRRGIWKEFSCNYQIEQRGVLQCKVI